MNVKKLLCLIIIACLMWNLSLSAEGFSVKLRGKLALAGILSGFAYLTHVLVKRDMRAAETLQTQLGRPERIIQIERGFDQWDVHFYREHSYFFLNNRFLRKKTNKTFFLNHKSPNFIGRSFSTYKTANWKDSFSSFSFTYTPVSVNPMWLQLSPLHLPKVLQSETPYPRLSEGGHSPVLPSRHPRLR